MKLPETDNLVWGSTSFVPPPGCALAQYRMEYKVGLRPGLGSAEGAVAAALIGQMQHRRIHYSPPCASDPPRQSIGLLHVSVVFGSYAVIWLPNFLALAAEIIVSHLKLARSSFPITSEA